MNEWFSLLSVEQINNGREKQVNSNVDGERNFIAEVGRVLLKQIGGIGKRGETNAKRMFDRTNQLCQLKEQTANILPCRANKRSITFNLSLLFQRIFVASDVNSARRPSATEY